MGQYTKFGFSGKALIAAFAVCTSFVACSSSDQSTEGHEEAMTQNAAQAEAEEARLANADQPKDEKVSAKAEGKVAKGEKPAKAGKTDKAAKTEKKVAAHKVETTEKKAKAHRVPASAGGGVYVVQVGAFKVKENAEKLEAKLKTAGFPVEMHSIEHSKNGLLHLVQLSPVTNRAEAETSIEELQAKQDLHAQIVVASPDAH